MVVVGGHAVEEHDRASRDTGDGLREALIHARLEATRIERIEVGVERCVSLVRRVSHKFMSGKMVERGVIRGK